MYTRPISESAIAQRVPLMVARELQRAAAPLPGRRECQQHVPVLLRASGAAQRGADQVALVLPETALPAAIGAGGQCLVSLAAGTMRWDGADGLEHQAGGVAAPLADDIRLAVTGEHGLPVLFVDANTGRYHFGGIFRA